MCCSPWGCKESDMMKQPSNNVSGENLYNLSTRKMFRKAQTNKQTNKKNAKRESQARSTDTALFKESKSGSALERCPEMWALRSVYPCPLEPQAGPCFGLVGHWQLRLRSCSHVQNCLTLFLAKPRLAKTETEAFLFLTNLHDELSQNLITASLQNQRAASWP